MPLFDTLDAEQLNDLLLAGSNVTLSIVGDKVQVAAIIPSATSNAVFTQTNSVTVGNTTTEVTLLGTGVGTLTIAANTLTIGKTMNLRISGFASRGSGTLTLRFKFGATNYATVALSVNSTNNSWWIDLDVTCRTVGVSGTVIVQPRAIYNTTILSAFVNTVTQTINTTIANTFNVTAQWSTAAAGNTITSTNCSITSLN